MRRQIVGVVSILGAVLACLAGSAGGGLTPLSAAAQGVPGAAVAQSAQTAQGVLVDSNLAQVDFGNAISFQLRAHADEPIRSVLFLYQVDDSPVQNTGVPGYQPGPAVTATYQWRVANVLVPGTQVRYQWQVETASGQTATTKEQSVTYNDTRFNWRELSTDQVTVFFTANDQATAQSLLDEVTKTQQRLSRDFGLTPDKRIRVYAYTRQQDYLSALQAARPSDPGLTVGDDRIFVLAPGGTANMITSLGVLRREVGNAIFLQKTKNPYAEPPRWLSTGFGLYVMGQDISADNYKALGQLAGANKLLPLKTLSGNFPSGNQEVLATVESLSAVQFIADTYGAQKLRALFAAIKDGNSTDDAVRKGLGVTFDQMETRWKNALKNGSAAKQAASSSSSSSSSGQAGQRGGQGTAGAARGDGAMDRFFGPAIDYWQGVFGRYTKPVLVGGAAFIVLGVLAAIGAAVVGSIRRANAEE